MEQSIDIVSPAGETTSASLSADAARVDAAAGFTYRITGRADETAPWIFRSGDDLVVEGLAPGGQLVITNFYTECSPAQVCTLLLSGYDGVTNLAITPATQPIAALSGDRFLMFGAEARLADATGDLGGNWSPWVTISAVAGAIGIGIGASVAGGGSNDTAVGSSPAEPIEPGRPLAPVDPPASPPSSPSLVPPTVIIASDTRAGETPNRDVRYTFTFSEPVNGFTADDIDVTGGLVTQFSGSGANYIAVVTPTTGQQGQLAVSVATNSAATADGLGNEAGSATPVNYDRIAPDLNITDDVTGSARGPVQFTFTFTEPVIGFTIDDVTVVSTGGALLVGNLQAVTEAGGSVYTLTVIPATTEPGILRISVADNHVTDAAGNGNIGSLQIQPFADSSVILYTGEVLEAANQPSIETLVTAATGVRTSSQADGAVGAADAIDDSAARDTPPDAVFSDLPVFSGDWLSVSFTAETI